MITNQYCLCHKSRTPLVSPPGQVELMLGAALYSEQERSCYLDGRVGDDTGDSISHNNGLWGSLTGLYWVWKNVRSDFKSVHTYRLFWEQYQIDPEPGAIYVPLRTETIVVEGHAKVTDILSQFGHIHGTLLMDLLWATCRRMDLGVTPEMVDSLATQSTLYPFNMFMSNAGAFDLLCERLFTILFALQDRYYYLVPHLETVTGQSRQFDFLSERVLHILLENAEITLPGHRVVELPIINIPVQ
jgi:hypothetical protein